MWHFEMWIDFQGYGLFTMEEIKIRPDGIRLTRGPGNYKIPSADDAPRQFHVRLLKGSSNKMGIFSSKVLIISFSLHFFEKHFRDSRQLASHHYSWELVRSSLLEKPCVPSERNEDLAVTSGSIHQLLRSKYGWLVRMRSSRR